MAKFRVLVHAMKVYSVEVEAEDATQARTAATKAVKDGKAGPQLGQTGYSFPSTSKVR